MSLGQHRSSGRTGLSARIARRLPERQILIRARGRVGYVVLSRRLQLAGMLGVVALGGWVVFATVGYVSRGTEIQKRDVEIGAARLALRDARDEMARGRATLDAVVRRMERNHGRLLALLNEGAAGDSIAGPDRAADPGAAADLLAGAPAPDSLAGEGRRLAAERAELMRQFVAAGDRLDGLGASQREVLDRLSAGIADRIEAAEQAIAMTGLDVDGLLGASGQGVSDGAGQGGPFIPAAADGSHPTALERDFADLDGRIERWDTLRDILGRLPLRAPSAHYYVSSGFGKRRDPLNRRWAMHYGVDLAGVLRSPILATAPGTVVFASRKGRFGRMVEIDHGTGIRSRYGHLHRIEVKRGQKVDAGAVVGQMGNSGRSTGVHVHYEVLVNGVPRNPLKFMEAGKHVHKG